MSLKIVKAWIKLHAHESKRRPAQDKICETFYPKFFEFDPCVCQVTAQEMAVVVEEVHLSSENNRKDATKVALDQYFALFKSFTKDF